MDLPVLLVSPEIRDCQVPPDVRAFQASPEAPEILVLRVPLASAAPQAGRESRVRWVSLVSVATPDPRVRTVLRVLLGCRARCRRLTAS